MPKKELPQFPTVEFELTAGQKKKLARFAQEIDQGYVSQGGKDTRRATLANITLARGAGRVQVFLIRPPQTEMIQRAIVRARRSLKEKNPNDGQL